MYFVKINRVYHFSVITLINPVNSSYLIFFSVKCFIIHETGFRGHRKLRLKKILKLPKKAWKVSILISGADNFLIQLFNLLLFHLMFSQLCFVLNHLGLLYLGKRSRYCRLGEVQQREWVWRGRKNRIESISNHHVSIFRHLKWK